MKAKILWILVIIEIWGLVALPLMFPNPHYHEFHSPPQPYYYPKTP